MSDDEWAANVGQTLRQGRHGQLLGVFLSSLAGIATMVFAAFAVNTGLTLLAEQDDRCFYVLYLGGYSLLAALSCIVLATLLFRATSLLWGQSPVSGEKLGSIVRAQEQFWKCLGIATLLMVTAYLPPFLYNLLGAFAIHQTGA